MNYVNYDELKMVAAIIQDFCVCEIVNMEFRTCYQYSTVNAYMAPSTIESA